jgi:hypothetical protein
VVIEQNDNNLVSPKVKVFFSTKSNTYIPPEVVDLSRSMGAGGGDKIVSHESPGKWRIDPLRFLYKKSPESSGLRLPILVLSGKAGPSS